VDHQFSAEAGLFPAVPANARLPEHLPPDGDPLPVAGPFQVGQPVVIVPKGKIGQKILHRFNPQPVQIFRPLFPHAGHLGDGDFRQLHSFVGVPKILRSSARPVGVAASPPKAVSFSDTGISRPIRYIASITSSVGITLRTPARAMSAATMAMAAPIALRLTQGASTNVATGSHTRPSMFFKAMATASADMEGVPPAISTTAAAAIPVAEPTSAWQPPAAPEINALLAITYPMAPPTNRARTICSRLLPKRSAAANTQPGRMPQEPAVGVATIVPIAAFTSEVAVALATASRTWLPESRTFALFRYWSMRRASPPVKPLWERTSSSSPRRMAFSITSRLSSIFPTIRSRGCPVASISERIITS